LKVEVQPYYQELTKELEFNANTLPSSLEIQDQFRITNQDQKFNIQHLQED